MVVITQLELIKLVLVVMLLQILVLDKQLIYMIQHQMNGIFQEFNLKLANKPPRSSTAVLEKNLPVVLVTFKYFMFLLTTQEEHQI